jgi:UDPglucose--hexose-1-phosphate uridylyltransferase
MNPEFFQHPHRRRNILTGEWVSVSPHRTARPWQGKVETVAAKTLPSYDPQCYLCAGNLRANGERNPAYAGTFAFDNDFAAFRPTKSPATADGPELLQATAHAGQCRVLCFSERHDLTLAELSVPEIRGVVDLWIDEMQTLGLKWPWVQVFENKGDVMGCSNPHPHGQIWATDFIPNEPAKEASRQQEYFIRHRRPLLLEYARLEMESGERIVAANDDWLAIVPWWAVWPFETIVVPVQPCSRMVHLGGKRRDSLAALLKTLLGAYDGLFATSFPYSMGWHGAPFDGHDHPEWTLHAHFYPPLLRSATVKKFMVGYEMMAEAQRDLTPEQAAQRLREACGKVAVTSPELASIGK